MKKLIITLFLFFVIFGQLQSQSYTFSKRSESYTELTAPIPLNNSDVWDFPDYTIPFGFDVWYFDTTIDTLYFFSEGAATILSTSNVEGGFHQLLIPFGAALIDRGYGTSTSQSPLSYEATGTTGERILKIQWKNAGFFGDFQANGFSTDYINFQLWIYETSGLIEMHYGPSLITYPNDDYTNGVGPAVGLIPSYDWDNDTLSSASLWLAGYPYNPYIEYANDLVFLNGSIMPDNVYAFHNVQVGVHHPENTIARVYPNPVHEVLTVQFNSLQDDIYMVEIYNANGQPVFFATIESSSLNSIDIHVAHLNPGVYYLNIVSDHQVSAIQFVKL